VIVAAARMTAAGGVLGHAVGVVLVMMEIIFLPATGQAGI
jgi:hypothetical protein